MLGYFFKEAQNTKILNFVPQIRLYLLHSSFNLSVFSGLWVKKGVEGSRIAMACKRTLKVENYVPGEKHLTQNIPGSVLKLPLSSFSTDKLYKPYCYFNNTNSMFTLP